MLTVGSNILLAFVIDFLRSPKCTGERWSPCPPLNNQLSAPPNANAETQRLQTQIPQTQIPCETSLANATQTQVGKRKTQRLGANATPKQSKRNDSVRDIPRKRNPNASGANAAIAKANANANANARQTREWVH